MTIPLDPYYDHSHEQEAPATPPQLYVGLAFAVIFEAIAAVVAVLGAAIYHFITHF